jgi:hypothetical protein
MAEQEVKKGPKASDVLKVLGGLAAMAAFGGAGGGIFRAAGAMGGGGRGRGGIASAVLNGAALDYPELPDDFLYNRFTDPGNRTTIDGVETVLPAMNSGWDFRNADAALVQTLQAHNRAVANGTEKDLEEWWPGEDSHPRRYIHPRSTAVEGIMLRPDGKIQVKWIKGSKWYTYNGGGDLREATEAVKSLMTAPSIGRALVRNGKRAWGDSKHVIDKAGHPDPNLGFWGKKHYENDQGTWRPDGRFA